MVVSACRFCGERIKWEASPMGQSSEFVYVIDHMCVLPEDLSNHIETYYNINISALTIHTLITRWNILND